MYVPAVSFAHALHPSRYLVDEWKDADIAERAFNRATQKVGEVVIIDEVMDWRMWCSIADDFELLDPSWNAEWL